MNVVVHERLEASASDSGSSWGDGAEQLGQPPERGLRTSCPTPTGPEPSFSLFLFFCRKHLLLVLFRKHKSTT